MSVGEKARFRVKPNYAYGERGNPSLEIPPNSELTYIIEVVDVKNQIWVTPDGTFNKHIHRHRHRHTHTHRHRTLSLSPSDNKTKTNLLLFLLSPIS
jgi:FKBP-type peptidyl-prolyl cis-trans isomerase 2